MVKSKKKPNLVVGKKINKNVINKKATKLTKTSNEMSSSTNAKKASNVHSSLSSAKDFLKNINKPLTRNQQINYLATVTSLPKKEVVLFMNSLEPMIEFHLKNLQEISVGGLMKIVVVKKPAVKAKEGINPFNGQPTIFKAKPARKVVKIRALKKIKDMVI